MNIGNRIKRIRRELNLTQTEFAARIGSVQNTVTGYENGRRNPSSPVISLICREFNVNEQWLRTGEGEMFKVAPTDILDQLADEYNLSDSDCIMIEKFISLRPEIRNGVFNFLKEVTAAFSDLETERQQSSIPQTPEELEKEFPPVEPEQRKTDTG